MPKHEPEVLAAIRRRKPLGRVVIDDDFPGTETASKFYAARGADQYMHSGKIYTSCDSKASLHTHSSAKGVVPLPNSSWSSPITREMSSLSGENRDR